MMVLLKNGLILALLAGLCFGAWWQARQPGRFPLREVYFHGMQRTNPELALDTLAAPKGHNLLTIDLTAARKRLEGLPWIRRARISRVYPDALVIGVSEKVAVSLGRDGEVVTLLDEYGLPIKPLEKGDPLLFPVVTPSSRDAEGAAEVVRLINIFQRHAWIREQLSEAVSLSGDRWILHTRRGIKLLLAPTTDGLEMLHKMEDRFKILERKIQQVDLRIPGRAIVKP